MIKDLVELRAAGDDDLNFIRHSWLRSLRSSGWEHRNIKADYFFKGHGKLMARCLDRSYCMLATPNGMGNIIVGYIVWEPGADKTLIHYIYTKQDYRNMGLASYLIDTIKGDKELIATARGSRFRELTYNPYLLIEGNKDGEESNNEKDSTSTETSTKDD